MPDSQDEVAKAKKAISDMLAEKSRPTQRRISTATGLTQGYVAKINQCKFDALNPGVRRVVEYSQMSPQRRLEIEAAASGLARRVSEAAERLAARDPALGEALAEFIDRIARIDRSR